MQSKLILIEGLPGSGKTTTSQLVFELVQQMNRRAALYMEGNPDHPADYEGTACFTREQLDQLLASIPDEWRALFHERIVELDRYYFLPYQKFVSESKIPLPSDVYEVLARHDVYELPPGKNIEVIAGKWRRFAEQARNREEINIFECCFIQNPVTIGMIKYNAPKEQVIDYVQKLARIIESLDPLLIYVEQSDLAASFRKAVQERPKEWFDGFVSYYTSQGYGKAHGYADLEGTIQVLQARAELEREILGRLKIKTIRMNNSSFDKEKYRSELERIIGAHLGSQDK